MDVVATHHASAFIFLARGRRRPPVPHEKGGAYFSHSRSAGDGDPHGGRLPRDSMAAAATLLKTPLPVADGSEEEEQFRISGASRMRRGDPIVAASTSSMKNVESPRLDRLICCLILQNYKGREEDVVVADDGALGIWCLCGTWRCPRGQRPCSAALDLQPTHEPHRRPLTMVIYQTCFLQLTVLGNLHRG